MRRSRRNKKRYYCFFCEFSTYKEKELKDHMQRSHNRIESDTFKSYNSIGENSQKENRRIIND